MFDFIAEPLGRILYFIYENIAFESYGLAIIIFTVIIKIILLPLSVKQQKSMSKIQKIQPQIKEIQQKYKDDKEKLSQEMMKIYKENNANPASGCLPLVIQMPIIISLFYILRRPLTFIIGMSKEKIFELAKDFELVQAGIGNYAELISKNMSAEVQIIKESGEYLNMEFLNLNLGIQPSLTKIFSEPSTYVPLLILVILTVATMFLSSKISMASKKQTEETEEKGGMMAIQKNMIYLGPVMILFVAFRFPAGLSLYWLISNAIQLLQNWYINKFVKE